jgi:hypothetical protein
MIADGRDYCRMLPIAGQPGRFRCAHCGFEWFDEIVRRCPGLAPRVRRSRFPPPWRMVWNLLASLAAWIFDGFRIVSSAERRRRLAVCWPCEARHNLRCLDCGCSLTMKSLARVWQCPRGKWRRPEDEPR